ncbi:DUF6276 family protein [Halovivax cerinus]|uniref:DUF6276 family protein n=1 Tax=Halovivax cerinus TaxID=1487865 RepID=A0ABD5NKY2_9EURY|nr:DUF6276 family protein [Halovivax cerinus]
MVCSCDVGPIVFAVPDSLRACGPDSAPAASLCPTCLSVEPVSDPPTDDPDFSRVSDAFPDGRGGVAMALTIGLLDSLAHNRAEIETTLEAAERAGVDPLLVVDRLQTDDSVDSDIDLERRHAKLESLLY